MKCSRKNNLGREGHIEGVHLRFVAEIILVVITDKMFPSTRMACLALVENGMSGSVAKYCVIYTPFDYIACIIDMYTTYKD